MMTLIDAISSAAMETAEEELLDLLTCHRSESCPKEIDSKVLFLILC